MTLLQDDTVADLRRANAALQRMLDEQRAEHEAAQARETALAEVLDVINGSSGDPAPVFEAVLEKAIRLCESSFGTFIMFDGEGFNNVAMRGVTPALAEVLSKPIPVEGLALSRILRGEDVIHVADITDDEVYRSGNPARRALTDLGGARTQLLVALRKDDRVLGAFNIFRQEVRPFSEQQVALLRNFAAQAVIAIENTRLLDELRQRTGDLQESLEYQTATTDVLKVISRSTFDLQPVLETLLVTAARLCGADNGLVTNREGDAYRVAATFSGSPEYIAYMHGRLMAATRGSVLGRAAQDARVVHIADIAADPEYTLSQTVALRQARTLLGVPLLREGFVVGVIVLGREQVQPFTDRQVELLRAFADQAVIAMENARLLGELRARTDELAQRQAELRVTFENMGDGVAMFDEAQRLVAWNRKFQEILEVPDAMLSEQRTYAEYIRYLVGRGEFGPAADREAQIRDFTDNAGRRYAYERTRPDGRVIEVRHNPIPSGGFVLIYSDITERKRYEAEIHAARDAAEAASRTIEAAYRDLKIAQANLIQAEKMASLGQLTAGIAHEIKNPLNFVNNFAIMSVELLDEFKETAAPALAMLGDDKRADVDEVVGMLTSNLGKIAEHGRRADGIVKSMLEHSRGASGERRTVDLNALVDDALNLAYHGARAQDQTFNIALQREFAQALAPIELNPQDITRVFLNLFSNGFYAATKRAQGEAAPGFEPVLKVTTRDLGDAVEVRVRDNGTGIPPDIRDKLFEPFFTTKPTGEGTGLGLSISYDIITQQHAGSITVDSEPGAYSEFSIRLPRHG